MRRISVLMAVIGFVSVACGEGGLLDGVGEKAQRAVVGTTTTSFAPPNPAGPDRLTGTTAAVTVRWYNDDIEGEAVGLPGFTISQVWERGHGEGRFIQSSRAEIAVALPGIRFPAEVPAAVSWVTSQLVYLEDVATLDAGTSAAFGLWELEPYSTDDGRVAVLRVGQTRDDVASGEVLEEAVTAGRSLVWSDGRYRYELFCRASLPEDRCHHMVSVATPLRDLLG